LSNQQTNRQKQVKI